MLTLGAVLEREGGERVGAHFIPGKTLAPTQFLRRLLAESKHFSKYGSRKTIGRVRSTILSAVSHALAFQVLLRNLGMVV